MERQNTVSFLLGAGFSVPAGYPTGNHVNEEVLELRGKDIRFTPAGRLVHGCNPGFITELDSYFPIFLDTIDYYANTSSVPFHYEEFFDFLKADIKDNDQYVSWCNDRYSSIKIDCNTIDKFLNIYNQIIENIIIPNNKHSLIDYNAFIKYVLSTSKDNTIHIHSLNHDFLLEKEILPGMTSDGYQLESSTCKCRNIISHIDEPIPIYTGNYYGNIRLYKLHGSFDQFVHDNEGLKTYVKISNDFDFTCIEDKYGNKDISNYHPDFLSGTTAKTLRYKEQYYKKLFSLFAENVNESKKLIVIGYSGKDAGINNLLIKTEHKSNMLIINPNIDKNFADLISNSGWHVIPLEKTLKEVTMSDFDF